MDNDNSNVKFAKPQDILQIVSFAYLTYKQTLGKGVPPDLVKITKTITDAVVNDVVLVFRDDPEDTEIQGVMVLKMSTPWWSHEPSLQQLFFYVKEDRKDRITILGKLLDGAKEYGIMNGMRVIQEVIGSDFSRKGKLLERKGFNQIGGSWIFETT